MHRPSQLQIKFEGSKLQPLILSMPLHIGSDVEDALKSGLDTTDVEDMTVFPVAIDQDLPAYDELGKPSLSLSLSGRASPSLSP